MVNALTLHMEAKAIFRIIFADRSTRSQSGFVGMLVAVPVAAALGVLARFAVDQYKQGRLYKGYDTQDDAGRD